MLASNKNAAGGKMLSAAIQFQMLARVASV